MSDILEKFKRVSVYGSTCSGKTTLAKKLGKILDSKTIHLDDIFWGPNWEKPTRDSFENLVRKELAADKWVSDGNYSWVRNYVLDRATFAVILVLPLPLIIWRLIARSISRNTKVKLQKVTPLPKRVKDSGVGERPIMAIVELSYWAIRHRRKKLSGIIEQVKENLGEKYLILHHQSEVDELVNKISLLTNKKK
ncbi:MAG: hypothetical protein ACTSO7_18065 [Candidatus Heimdallarchaeota archaeon]